jgi:hypothetical protein
VSLGTSPWTLGDNPETSAYIIVIIGLVIAAFFDLKAERLKRRGFRTPEPEKVTKTKAISKCTVIFIGYYILFGIMMLFLESGVLNTFDVENIPSISNPILRGFAWVTLVVAPAVFAFLLARRKYRRYEIVS